MNAGQTGSRIDFTIVHTRIDWGEIPVRVSFSYGKPNTFPFFVVRLRAGNAEGAADVVVPPNPFVEKLLARLVGADARKLDGLLPPPGTDHDRLACEPVSIALHDLVGKLSGLPVHSLLGGAGAKRIPLMPCLFPNSPEEARSGAGKWVSEGYRYLKVKLLGDLEEDLGRVRAIRSVAPADVMLQGDANEGYASLDAAYDAVARLGEAGLDIFEDPLKGGVADYAALCRRRRPGDAKVMVDMLARRTEDLAAVLREGATDVVGIHPVQPGSLTRARHHTRLAQSMGVPVVIGGTGYTGLSPSAYQHLAAVVTPESPCGALGGFFDHGMPRNMARAPLPMREGTVEIPDCPGLGVDLDEDVLAEFSQGSKEWAGSCPSC